MDQTVAQSKQLPALFVNRIFYFHVKQAAMNNATTPLALYIHWPFCRSKCPYCDFNSHVSATIDHAAWREAYGRELNHYAKLLQGRRISSVFFGGGTPSLMDATTVSGILDDIAKFWSMGPNIEITLEANPTSVEAEKFAAFRAAGINRLSLGVQALNDADLKFLGREHNTANAIHAIELARHYFIRYSFDLIYARREQTLDAWEKELQHALSLSVGHLSLYQLTIEPSTQFYTLSQRGERLTAPEETAAAMFELTQDILTAAGMPAYEISNHARIGEESRHNLTYWHYQDYIGIGPGAHGRYTKDGARFAIDNHRAPEVWLKHVRKSSHGVRQNDILDANTAMREATMMGLRLTEGISLSDWTDKFGITFSDFVTDAKIQKLISEGYLIHDTNKVRATANGLLRLNALLSYLLT